MRLIFSPSEIIRTFRWFWKSNRKNKKKILRNNKQKIEPWLDWSGFFCLFRFNISVRAFSLPRIDFSSWFFTVPIDGFFVDEHEEICWKSDACPPAPIRWWRFICFLPLYSNVAIERSSNWIRFCSCSRLICVHKWRRIDGSTFFNNQRKQINKSRDVSSLKVVNELKRFWKKNRDFQKGFVVFCFLLKFRRFQWRIRRHSTREDLRSCWSTVDLIDLQWKSIRSICNQKTKQTNRMTHCLDRIICEYYSK